MEQTLKILLDKLHENAEMPAQASLYHFSNLDAEDAARVQKVWESLPIELRQRMVAKLMRMAEVDFELNFGAIFRLGLEDEDAQVRKLSIEGLWEDEDVRLVSRLVELLQEDESAAVRAAAATSLGRFILLGELEEIRPDPFTLAYETTLAACQDLEEDIEVRRRALESVSYIGDQVVTQLIGQAYAAPEEKLHASAIFAMGRSLDPRWASQVQKNLFNSNPELRCEAAKACGKLQLREATLELEDLADDVDFEVQEAALWALGQIGGDKACEILEHYCDVEDEAVRTAAKAAMNELEFLHGNLSELLTTLVQKPPGK